MRVRNVNELLHLLAGGRLILIKWTADWCGPCRALAPKLAQLAEEFPAARFIDLDIDNKEFASLRKFNKVTSIPRIQLVRGPEVVAELNVAPPLEQVRSALARSTQV